MVAIKIINTSDIKRKFVNPKILEAIKMEIKILVKVTTKNPS